MRVHGDEVALDQVGNRVCSPHEDGRTLVRFFIIGIATIKSHAWMFVIVMTAIRNITWMKC